MHVGVLGLQGDVSEHVEMLKKLCAGKVTVVKKPQEIKALDGLIIPGGESTTIVRLLKRGIEKEIKSRRLAIFGTCAGSILLAKEILGSNQYQNQYQNQNQFSLKLMDIKVRRNAYGRQRESFEADLKIPIIGKKIFRGVFIRAPVIKEVGKGVEVLARFNGEVVLARQGRFLASTFHPELTGDARIHRYFLGMIK